MAGRIDWAKFTQKVYEAFDNKVNSMLYEATMSAGDKVLPADQFTKSLEMIASNKATIIELVDDVASANGEEAVIMGTKVALNKLSSIVSAEWISNDMKQERHTTGKLGVWEGITFK